MRRYIKFLFMGTLLILTINGCKINEDLTESIKNGEFNGTINPNPNPKPPTPPPAPPKPPKSVDKKFYGYWVYVEDGSYEKIDKNFSYPIISFGDNLIEIEREGKSYTLLRKGSNNGSVSGLVYSDVTKLEKFSKRKNKKVAYYVPSFKKGESNNLYITIKDGFTTHRQKIKSDGSFYITGIHWFGGYSEQQKNTTISKLIAGDNGTSTGIDGMGGSCTIVGCDDYESGIIEVNEKNETVKNIFEGNISLPTEDTNIGNFFVPDKEDEYNFKTKQIIDIQDKDDRYMYENRTYQGKLFFKNIGTKPAEGLSYEIRTDDPYVVNLTNEPTLGTVEANQSKEIPFEITFGMLDKIKHNVKLDFIIKDANGKKWLDNVYLDVYQTPITVNIKTKSSKVKGYFITPEHDILNIDTKDIAVKIPRRPDGKYFLVISTPKSLEEETAYAIGVDVEAPSLEGFKDTSAYEPDNSEESATKLKIDDEIRSYVHRGNIDFYTIEFKSNISFTPPSLPFH